MGVEDAKKNLSDQVRGRGEHIFVCGKTTGRNAHRIANGTTVP
jgi:hypothetical protein